MDSRSWKLFKVHSRRLDLVAAESQLRMTIDGSNYLLEDLSESVKWNAIDI